MGRKSRDSVSANIAFPAWHGNMHREGILPVWCFSQKTEELVPHQGPQSLGCTRETSPQNVWLRKPTGMMSRDPKWHKKLRFPSYRAHVHSHLSQDPVKKKKGRSLKSVQRLLCEGNWFANLKAYAGGAEDRRNSSWRWRYWWTILLPFPATLLAPKCMWKNSLELCPVTISNGFKKT